MADGSITVGGRKVGIGKPDKVLFSASQVNKRELAEYYATAGSAMLPHLRGRPLALHRFPDGIEAEGFFQKRRPENAPDWVGGARVSRETGGEVTMVVAGSAAALVWLVGQAMITAHPWLSKLDHLRRPDRVVFDLDPPGDDFAAVKSAAWDLRDLLDELVLPSYVMTTGSRGLHVVVPIRAELDFDDVRDFARGIADLLAWRHPERLTTRVRKDQRNGRLFVDVLRNAYAQHTVAPFAVRPLPEAPVAMPVRWEELEKLDSARAWTVHTAKERLAEDPWASMARRAHSLVKAQERLRRMRRG